MKSSLCDCKAAYIHMKGAITITGVGADASTREGDKRNKWVIFKNCALLI